MADGRRFHKCLSLHVTAKRRLGGGGGGGQKKRKKKKKMERRRRTPSFYTHAQSHKLSFLTDMPPATKSRS